VLRTAVCSTREIGGKFLGMDLAHTRERPNLTLLLMSAAFVIALALAAIFLIIFGAGERGTAIALRATARWSFLLFWSAYAGGAIAWLWPRFNVLARHGRELGLSYASAQLIHVGLVFWIIHVATGPSGAMVFFWIGIFCTYLLALLSLPRLRDALDTRLWRILRTIAMEYIAIAFTSDFINLHSHELGKLSYLPFALMLVGGAGLRLAAFWDRRSGPLRENLASRIVSPFTSAQFRMSRADYLVVWPALLFVAAIVILLAVDDALRGTWESVLALYGPSLALLGGYVLFKSAARGARLISGQLK
jgi:hypothetical protein